MSDQVRIVIIAAAQSVAKVYLIGAVGYLAAIFPRSNPLFQNVKSFARFTFQTLTVCLIYSTIAKSVNPSNILEYWFVIVGGFGVLSISFLVAKVSGTILGIHNPALMVAATFPNIVALPILIFPSLCEFEDLRIAYKLSSYEECVETTNTMVFLYFSAWSVGFWTCGYLFLVPNNSEDHSTGGTRLLHNLQRAVTSSGFVALFAGIVTGCLPWISDELFEVGGCLRFLGDAVETLGEASPPLTTMIVAASLVPDTASAHKTEHSAVQGDDTDTDLALTNHGIEIERAASLHGESMPVEDGNANSGLESSTVGSTTSNATQPDQHQPMFDYKLTGWFLSCRLVLSPAVIVSVIYVLDRFVKIPKLCQFVIILNSCLPGALIVVVILTSEGDQAVARQVSKVYLPCYLVSILTIAIWSALGLYLTTR